MPEVVERNVDVAGLRTHGRAAQLDKPNRVLDLQGAPKASWDWLPYLERTGGVAPDLPGFGRTAKPIAYDYSIAGLDRAPQLIWTDRRIGVGSEANIYEGTGRPAAERLLRQWRCCLQLQP